MIIRVEEYIRKDGSSPYRAWFDGLDPQAAAKVATAKVRLSMGNTSRVKWLEGIGEYRIDWGPGYRIYLARDGNRLIVLFGGGTRNGGSKRISTRPRSCTPNTRRGRLHGLPNEHRLQPREGDPHGTDPRFQADRS